MVEGESSRGGGREEALQENKGGSKGEEKIRWREREPCGMGAFCPGWCFQPRLKAPFNPGWNYQLGLN